MSHIHDVCVVGLGAMGSATAYYLSKEGLDIIGFDSYGSIHDHGSHGGDTRLIRMAYFEHPDYVPLLQRAYENWEQISEVSGQKLFHKTGLRYYGPSDSELIRGVKKSAELYDIPLEQKSNYTLEPNAGFLDVNLTLRAYQEHALMLGAQLNFNSAVVSWKKHRDHFVVQTQTKEIKSCKIVFTAGAWSGELITHLNRHLNVTQQWLGWFEEEVPGNYEQTCWGNVTDEGYLLYGFPSFYTPHLQRNAIKIALHKPGKKIRPENKSHTIDEKDLNELTHYMNEFFPTKSLKLIDTRSCIYTNSADENFIIDKHPSIDGVYLAAGFSGHGFKFVCVVGEILKELVTKDKTELPIGFLSYDRL